MVAFNEGFNFRATLGFVTDPPDTQFVNRDTYPKTSGGVTWGFEARDAATASRDRSTAVDPRLAGVNWQANNGTQAVFRVDLAQTGPHAIRAAFGDASFGTDDVYAEFLDGTTVFATIDKLGESVSAGQWYDATGVLRASASDWVANNAALQHDFQTQILRVRLGQPTDTAGQTTIAHLQVEFAGGGEPIVLTAEPGAVSITGHAAALRAGRRIGADAGAVTLAAQDAALRRDARVSAEAGSVALAVQDAGLRADRRLVGEAGALALTAGDAGLRHDRRLTAEAGAVTLTARDATLSTSSDKTLTAEPATIALTAHDATLRRDARLPVEAGAVTITPTATGLLRHGRLLAEPGSLAIGAAAARLLRHRAISAEPASVAIAAQPAALRATRRLLAEGAAVALMARDADLRAAKPTATPRGPITPAVARGLHMPAVARDPITPATPR